MAKELRALGWDYLMFAIFIGFTIFVPLWKRLLGKAKQRSKADYVFATGSVSIVAIMLSIARGTLGVRTVLGYPSELFYRGSAMWEIIYGMASAYPIVCFIFVPVYFNLGITSVYQYIDLRFKSRLVRCLASATYIVRQICSLGVAVYTPSVALATVIGIPYWASIVGITTICIFFTTIGGLKAAINADVIQTVTVIIVTVIVIITGTITSGGVQKVFDVNKDDGRLKFFNFTGDMTVRVDTTSAWLGQLFMSLSQFGCQQNFMQRYVSLKSLSEVKRAMMSNIPVIFVFFSLSWLSGMVIYSTYANCDPYADGFIQKRDEILPFFIEDKLSIIPGFAGIFVAMLFNGALCMMVSNLNSLATVCWEDFLSQLPQFRGLADKQQLGALKVITVVCGLIIMGVAFGVGLLSGVIESSMLAFSATSGPLLGCFILAMLVPFANWKGTSAGMIASCSFVLWIISGAFTTEKTMEFLPTSTEGCTNYTFASTISRPAKMSASWLKDNTPMSSLTMFNETEFEFTTDSVQERTPLETFYSISYMYYSLIGSLITVAIGVIVSYWSQDEKDSYDSKLLHPLVFNFCQRFKGPKPYHIKEDVADLTAVTKGAQINHAFDSQNESNLIIGANGCTTVVLTNGNGIGGNSNASNISRVCGANENGKQKDKSPIDSVVFTQATSVVSSNNGKQQNEQLNPITENITKKDDSCESGSYRRFSEKDLV